MGASHGRWRTWESTVIILIQQLEVRGEEPNHRFLKNTFFNKSLLVNISQIIYARFLKFILLLLLTSAEYFYLLLLCCFCFVL